MPYRFFFSYARNNRDPFLDQFYSDLCTQVKLRKYHAAGTLDFFDGKGIRAGDDWKAGLGSALCTAKTFVAVCSPDYINSEYCGKELRVFVDRYRSYMNTAKPAEQPRLIQPILWGAPSGSLHHAISGFQYTDDDYPAVYAKEGLRYMMQLSDHEDDYKRFVTRLAQKLVDQSEQHTLPDQTPIANLDEVESVFAAWSQETSENDGSNAWFVFVAGRPDEFPSERTSVDRYKLRGGRDWKPFVPESTDSVGIIAQTTASRYRLYFAEMLLDDQIESRIEEAERRRELVFVFVDAWTLRIAGYRDRMRKLDRRNFENCVVMVPVNRPDPETDRHLGELEDIVTDTFRWKKSLRNKLYFRDSIGSARELQSLVLKSFAEFSNASVEKKAKTRRIKNRRIRQDAKAEGISLDKTPLVTSPWGQPV